MLATISRLGKYIVHDAASGVSLVRALQANSKLCRLDIGNMFMLSKQGVRWIAIEPTFQCPNQGCKELFVSQYGLRRHLQCYHVNKRYKCSHPGCDYSCDKKQMLQMHAYKHKDEHIRCKYTGCHYNTTNPTNMQKHILRAHVKGEYKCGYPECDYFTSTKVNLQRHEKLHLLGKRYHCIQEGCNYAAKSTAELTSHQFLIHSIGDNGERLKCAMCKYTTTRKAHLARHQASFQHYEKIIPNDEHYIT